MPSRPSWQGYLKMSLVTCPVKLYRGVRDAPGIAFHLLDAKTHHRIQMKPVDPGRGEVDRDELVHG
jgi:DNA end-binding protein Ku